MQLLHVALWNGTARSTRNNVHNDPCTPLRGPMLWPLEDAAEIMRWYCDFIAKAPDDVYGFFAFRTVEPVAPFLGQLHNKKMCGIVWCYTGSIKKGDKVFKPIRSFKARRHGRPNSASGTPKYARPSLPAGPAMVLEGRFRAHTAGRSHRCLEAAALFHCSLLPGAVANTASTQVEFNRLDILSAITASVLASSLRLL